MLPEMLVAVIFSLGLKIAPTSTSILSSLSSKTSFTNNGLFVIPSYLFSLFFLYKVAAGTNFN